MFISIFHNFIFIQIIGLVGLFFTILAWNAKTRNKILTLQSIGSLIYVLHYCLLFAFTGAIMNGMMVTRNLVFNQKDKKKWASHKAWLFIFMIALVFVCALSWQGWISILPTIGLMLGTYGIWQNSPKKIRFYIFLACIAWTPYTIIVHSYSGLIAQLFSMAAIIVANIRLKNTLLKEEGLV